ncbi:MAG: septum formation inhibitor Maf [Gammaproteobacteria bacterium]|nr:septum formation inhibitor Maf [Gammaproteobacteria bacterium]
MDKIKFEQLCLASQSPRRRELLEQIGVKYFVLPADIDESIFSNEPPKTYVKRMALQKANAVLDVNPDIECPVLASDTAVVIGDEVLGKPADKQDGMAMLSQLSGNTHQVLTSIAMTDGKYSDCVVVESEVTFRVLSSREIEKYWMTGEGLDKAGCYAVQGLAASFITQITGSFSGVMGLPLRETSDLLSRWGVRFWLNAPTNSEVLS